MVTNLKQFMAKYSDEIVCREHLIKQRWPDGNVTCQYCGHNKCYRIENGDRFKCANNKCYKRFRVTVGTIFEASNVKLSTWFAAQYLIMNHKKGISSCQLARDLGVTQKTAWFMLHRIREQLKANNSPMLSGTVEIDETFVGGIVGNMNKSRRAKLRTPDGGTLPNKTMVVGMVERGGDLKLFAGGMTNNATDVLPKIFDNVNSEASLITDSANAYCGLGKNFAGHEVVNHGLQEYVRLGGIHTNTIEGAFSMLKRSIIGIYHHVTPKHLSRYCDETSFRYNTRKITDPTRFDLSLTMVEGRLTYKQLIAKKENSYNIADPNSPAMKVNPGRRSTPIYQIKDGEIIQEFPTIKAAASILGISKKNICHALRGRRKSAGGFQWQYV